MDPELVTLASQAATSVVQLLTTEAWEKSKSAIGSLWRSVHPDRADRMEAEIADAHEDLLRVPQDADLKAALIEQWKGQLISLLTANPELAATLRRVVDEELRPALPRPSRPRSARCIWKRTLTGAAASTRAASVTYISPKGK